MGLLQAIENFIRRAIFRILFIMWVFFCLPAYIFHCLFALLKFLVLLPLYIIYRVCMFIRRLIFRNRYNRPAFRPEVEGPYRDMPDGLTAEEQKFWKMENELMKLAKSMLNIRQRQTDRAANPEDREAYVRMTLNMELETLTKSTIRKNVTLVEADQQDVNIVEFPATFRRRRTSI